MNSFEEAEDRRRGGGGEGIILFLNVVRGGLPGNLR